MRYLLDTDTCSYLIKGRLSAAEYRSRMEVTDYAIISSITCAELLYGIRRIDPSTAIYQGVHHFLATLAVLPWTRAAAGHYAEIRHQLTVSGNLIGELT